MLRYSIDHGFFAWPYFTANALLSNVPVQFDQPGQASHEKD
jgi:hypothetical protein